MIEHTYLDWQREVTNGDTRLGFNEWVEHQVEADQDERDIADNGGIDEAALNRTIDERAMTQHTPGPWTVERLAGKKGEKYVWMGGEYMGGHAIATVHDRIPERAEDNARLIAAAPELLEALQGMLANAPAPKGIGKDYSYILYREAAKTAIAKATGG
jgi:hypothetical protein